MWRLQARLRLRRMITRRSTLQLLPGTTVGGLPAGGSRSLWIVPALFGISIGGLYLGVFTPTEAGAVGAFLALVFSLLMRRIGMQACSRHSVRRCGYRRRCSWS